MFLGKVVGSVVSTAKHPAYEGRKLMILRLTTPKGELTDQTMVAADAVGAGVGDWVLIASEGKAVAEIMGFEGLGPMREIIVGIVDRVDV
jgi:microcompartment protein CcmK/EutM